MAFVDDKFVIDAISVYSRMVYRLAYVNMKSRADAEDVMQEVFMRLCNKTRKDFRDSEHLKAWLLRVTQNRCLDELKSTYRSKREQMTESTVYMGSEDSIIEEFKSLPEGYRSVLYLHYYEGYTAKEIGRILKLTQTAVSSRITRGRELLRLEIEEKD